MRLSVAGLLAGLVLAVLLWATGEPLHAAPAPCVSTCCCARSGQACHCQSASDTACLGSREGGQMQAAPSLQHRDFTALAALAPPAPPPLSRCIPLHADPLTSHAADAAWRPPRSFPPIHV